MDKIVSGTLEDIAAIKKAVINKMTPKLSEIFSTTSTNK